MKPREQLEYLAKQRAFKKRNREMHRLHGEGMTYEEIGRMFDVSLSRVGQIVREEQRRHIYRLRKEIIRFCCLCADHPVSIERMLERQPTGWMEEFRVTYASVQFWDGSRGYKRKRRPLLTELSGRR